MAATYQNQYNAALTPTNSDTLLFLDRFAAALSAAAYQVLFVQGAGAPAPATAWAKSVVGAELTMAQKYALLALNYPAINALVSNTPGWAATVTDAQLAACATALAAGVV